VGLIGVGVVWLVMGRRKIDPATGLKRPFPAIFFIPMMVWAIPVLLLVPAAIFADQRGRQLEKDPRYQRCKTDEKPLDRAPVQGDQELAGKVLGVLTRAAPGEGTHILTVSEPDRVLILVKLPALKDFADAARRDLLDGIDGAVRSDPAGKDK